MDRRIQMQRALEPENEPNEWLQPETLQRLEEDGTQALRCGQYALGRDKFLILSDQRPNEERYWRGLGQAQLGLKNWRQARFGFERAVQIEPMNLSAALGLVESYRQLGEKDQALRALDVAQIICHCQEKHFDRLGEIDVLREAIS